jgi:hypothetical protein
MDDLKIDINTIGFGKDTDEIVTSCAAPFNKCISRLINNGWAKIKEFKNDPTIDSFVKNQDTIDSFERLKRNLELIRYELPLYALARSFPHVIKAGEHITSYNADYFLNRNYDELIKNDHNKTMIYDVIKLVVKCFKRLTSSEQEETWELANIMLLCSIEFKKHIKKTGLQYGQDPNTV